MKRGIPCILTALFLLLSATVSFGRKTASPEVARAPSSPPLGPVIQSGVSRTPANIASLLLGRWTFDDGSGNADTQGWTSVDAATQGPYFHVDNFLSVSAPYAPLEHSKSLWCGVTPCQTVDVCHYATLPGYGNSWDQRFESVAFNVSGNVDVDFYLRYDTETSYDFVSVEYASNDGVWHVGQKWSGSGNIEAYTTILSSAYSGPLKVRLRFQSDSSWSDEDGNYPTSGAAVIDLIHITDSGSGFVYNQGFESEAQGALATADGKWQAMGPPARGDFAALFDGSTVLQEDPNYTDATHLWGFFSGSPDDYTCGGHSGQKVVPFGTTVDGEERVINNEIQSPSVSLSGLTTTEPVLLSFDVYRDLPLDNLVFYEFRVRSLVSGVWTPWKSNHNVYYDSGKTWTTFTKDVRSLIATNATDIKVAIGALDMCPFWCGLFGTGACHSQGPLIDNVRVTQSNTSTGSNVAVQPVDETTGTTPVTVTFSSVTAPGLTSLVTSSTTCPQAPGSFTFGDGTCYNVSSTATFSGDFTLCIAYNPNTLTVSELSLRMLHWDTTQTPAAWVDITTSLDVFTHVICGTTDHFSPFAFGAGSVTGVGDTPAPASFALHPNLPNPFNPITTIRYDVPAPGADVSISIYDVSGRLIRSLVKEHRGAGEWSVQWDGENDRGQSVASGVYFYRMKAGEFVETKKMILLK